MEKKGKCICFARVSTVQQDLEQQTNELLLEAKRCGYNSNSIITIEYKESAIKLDEDEREGLNTLKEYIYKDKVECVIIYEISRLARKQKVLFSIRDLLIDEGIQLICLKPYLRLLDNDGKMSQTASIMFSLFSSLSESEMMIKKERMIRGRLAKKDKGLWIGTNMLLGYKHDENDNIYIDEKYAKVVVELFERYVRHESVRQITKDLFDRGLLPYNRLDTALVITKRMVKRCDYAGIYNNSYQYPAIISEELFRKAEEITNSRGNQQIRERGCYWCQGILYDTKSNRLLSPAKCTVSYKMWEENYNKGFSINLNYMDSIAWMVASELYTKHPIITVDEALSEFKKKLLNLHDKIIFNRERIKEIQKMNDRINDRIVRGKIQESKGDKMIDDNNTEIKNLSFHIRQWDSECVVFEQAIRERNKDKGKIINIDNLNDWDKKKLIQQQIKRIDIDKLDKSSREIVVYCYNGDIVHFTLKKHGNYTYIFRDGVELKEFNLIIRFRRKGSKYTAGWKKRV